MASAASLSVNLSSNNPFRNRAASPTGADSSLTSTMSPFDDPPPARPLSRNPFIDQPPPPLKSPGAASANSEPRSLSAEDIFVRLYAFFAVLSELGSVLINVTDTGTFVGLADSRRQLKERRQGEVNTYRFSRTTTYRQQTASSPRTNGAPVGSSKEVRAVWFPSWRFGISAAKATETVAAKFRDISHGLRFQADH